MARTVGHRAAAGLCGAVFVVVLALGAGSVHARPMGYDGHLIAFDRGGMIHLMSAADGSDQRPITAGVRPVWAPPTDIGGCQGEPPTPGVLAFESTHGPGGDADIYRMVPPNGTPVSLTEASAADDTAPAWAERSNDARLMLAYTSASGGGPRDIWVMDDNPATDDRVNLTNTPTVDERNPDWAPDGGAITFERTTDGVSQIWVMQVGSGANGQVIAGATYQATSGPEPKQEPTWVSHGESEGDVVEEGPVTAPQWGDRIAYAVAVGDFTYIDMIEHVLRPGETGALDRSRVFADPSQTTVWPMTGDPGDDSSPSWSPQGRRLLFERRDERGNLDIYVLSSQGGSDTAPGGYTGEPVRLTADPAADMHPDWRAFQACADMIPRPPKPARRPRRRRRELSANPSPVTPALPSGTSNVSPSSGQPGGVPPKCTITGTRRSDRLRGTAGRDVICGGAGRDRIAGLGGNDIIRAGTGNDIVLGGSGDDELVGASGDDDLRGQRGRDRLLGGRGRDRLDGGPGPDRLFGGAGRDLLIVRGGGADRADGGPGRDTAVVGGTGDVVRGVERRRR